MITPSPHPQIVLIDRILGELLELRAALAPPADQPPLVADVDEGWIDTATASERFNLPHNTVRWLCREKGMGEKRGGRWMISLDALKTYKRE